MPEPTPEQLELAAEVARQESRASQSGSSRSKWALIGASVALILILTPVLIWHGKRSTPKPDSVVLAKQARERDEREAQNLCVDEFRKRAVVTREGPPSTYFKDGRWVTSINAASGYDAVGASCAVADGKIVEFSLWGDDGAKQLLDHAERKRAELARQAVSHRMANGPGPRVDVYEMKGGKVVTCVTKVTDAGVFLQCDD